MPAPKTDTPAEGYTRCTVSRKGAGKISTGERLDDADITYNQGDQIDVLDATARAYEDCGYVAVI